MKSNSAQMKIKYFTLYCILFSTFMIGQTRPPESENNMRQRAMKIHESVITIDTHNDIDVKNFTDEINYTQDLDTQVNLPKMEEGGLDVSWLIVYTGQENLDKEGYKKAYKNAWTNLMPYTGLLKNMHLNESNWPVSADDVKRIHASGKKVAMIGVENAYPVGTDLRNIEKFYKIGARYMSLAHNGHSQFSDSNTGEEDGVWLYNGLSELGEQAIEEMNRLGIMIDISHPSKDAKYR